MMKKIIRGADMKTRIKTFRSGRFLTVLLAAILPLNALAETGEVGHKLTVKSFVDFGHLVSGYNPSAPLDPNVPKNITMLPLNRTGVTAIQEASLNRFDVAVGLTGLIWWPYGGSTTDPIERVMNVKPMIPIARARWQFGNPASVGGALQLGTFTYKYNPDARDLGEYLYRAGTYPGFLTSTEGWLLMNRASNYSHGALLTVTQMGGKVKHNFSLFMETQFYPIGDFSPGYDVSLTSKWLDVGGGFVLNHYLSSRPSRLTPKVRENAYSKTSGTQLSSADIAKRGYVYYGAGDPRNDSRVRSDGDTLVGTQIPDSLQDPNDTSRMIVNPDPHAGLVIISASDNGTPANQLGYYSIKGVKVMGRAALNLGSLLPENIRGPEDLRIFTEVAILGVKNYPGYYNKMSRRIPIMAGINLPTAKLLDVLSLQVEYYKSLYNDMDQFNVSSMPVWQTTVTDSVTRDDWKWYVYAKKTVNKLMTVYVQAADDHFRLTDGHYKASSIPLTSSPSDWYYLLRLEFALR